MGKQSFMISVNIEDRTLAPKKEDAIIKTIVAKDNVKTNVATKWQQVAYQKRPEPLSNSNLLEKVVTRKLNFDRKRKRLNRKPRRFQNFQNLKLRKERVGICCKRPHGPLNNIDNPSKASVDFPTMVKDHNTGIGRASSLTLSNFGSGDKVKPRRTGKDDCDDDSFP
ncbi:hypothetical protein AMTR_s00120p00093620 [Amborella trichopoda]|uniref:Uncharacterized protein n=1 Tax=Amborella trichopoda TaxID=13333 RepID=W1NTV3_AMBTC|nr:hypothetical protein AMTR_s00120p00093620 [Amborella trichopoda]